MHKQQVEYSETIESLRKKMEYTEKVAQENKDTLQMNIKLAGELEDYRSQTRRLIHDIQQKDQELVALRRAHTQRQSPQRGGDYIQRLIEVKDQHGIVKGDGDDWRNYESLERPKVTTVVVHTMEGVVCMNIQKPQTPLNAQDRPTVIVKRGNEYEAGTLMYVGTFDGEEIAGVQMSIHRPSEFEKPLIILQWIDPK